MHHFQHEFTATLKFFENIYRFLLNCDWDRTVKKTFGFVLEFSSNAGIATPKISTILTDVH